jgi:hypothetical protein
MAATLITDAAQLEQTRDGIRLVETYRVPTADLSGSGAARLHSALSVAGVPAQGAASTIDPTVVCVRRRVEPAGASGPVVNVICDYEVPSSDDDNPLLDTTGILRVSAGLLTERTFRDRDGAFMSVRYTGTVRNFWPEEFFAGQGAFGNTLQLIEAEVFRPQLSFELTRRYTGPGARQTVLEHARTYTGRINVVNWVGTVDWAARTVLCVDVQVDVETTEELRVTYAFEVRPATWDVIGVFTRWGRAPDNIDNPPGNGVGVFAVYDQADFNALPVRV